MTAHSLPLGASAAGTTRDPQAQQSDRKLVNAAHQFEGVLVQQMLKVLWQSSPVLAGPQGDLYRAMFEGALADHMVAAGGIGLSPMLERALGQKAGSPVPALNTLHQSAPSALVPLPAPVSTALSAQRSTPVSAPVSSAVSAPVSTALSAQLSTALSAQLSTALSAQLSTAVSAQRSGGASVGAPGQGELSRIQDAAAELLQGGGQRWSRQGELQARDLFADLGPAASGGMAHASVTGARGYQGYYKCNLFALEMARRAGFAVPLRSGDQGFAYPLSNDITRDAADGQLSAGWAHVVTGASASDLDASLKAGTRALMLTGEGSGQRHGHMAVVERIHSIEYGPNGNVQRIVFDGWEARPEGASHLRERSWNAQGHTGGHDPRNGFERIEILELRRPTAAPGPQNQPAAAANPERRDDLGSSLKGDRPIHISEEDS